jgi:glycosyltransferase involved in cell wall biosynthesis
MAFKVVHLTSVHQTFDNRIFHKQCKSLAKHGYKVVLITPHEKDQIIDGVRIKAVDIPSNRLSRMVVTCFQLFYAGIKEDANIYHFHDPELLFIGLILKLLKKNVIYDVHEDYAVLIKTKEYLPKSLRIITASIIGGIEKFVSNFLSAVILAEKCYQDRFPNGQLILNYPNMMNLELFNQHQADQEAETMPRLLYTGNVSRDRGALIHSNIVNLHPGVEVYMVGKCSQELAEKMINIAGDNKERLHIIGVERYVPFEEIVSYYQNGPWLAGLAIFPPHPRYYEKELTKFFEYMEAQMPIICSDFPGWKKFIRDQEIGMCVDPLNPQQIHDAIEYSLGMPEENAKMGHRGKSIVKSCNWEGEAEKLVNLYNQLISGSV